MSDPAILSSFLDRAWDWAWANKESVGSIIVAASVAFAWVWKNWIKPKPDKGVNQTQCGGQTNSQIGPVTGQVTVNQGGTTDFASAAKFLMETSEAKARAEMKVETLEGQLAEKDQQVEDLTAALAKAQSVASTPLVSAADHQITSANAQALAVASEATLEVYFKSKKTEGAVANREAAAAARHIGALAYLHDTQKALRFYREATDLDPDDPEAWNRLGHLLYRVGDLPNAEKSFERVLQLANTIADKGVLAVAYGNLGNVYRTRGNLDKAEEFTKKALVINEVLGRKEGMSSAYGNLGILYTTRGDLDKAEEFHKKSLAIEEALGRKEGMASDYGNLGILSAMRGNLDKAEEFFKKSLAIEEALGRKEGMASDYGNLGNIYRKRGDLNKAEEFFKKSLAIEEALGRKEGMASDYGNLGILYAKRGDLAIACEVWVTSRRLYMELGNHTRADQVAGWIRDADCPKP